jgi:hypothetical protein
MGRPRTRTLVCPVERCGRAFHVDDGQAATAHVAAPHTVCSCGWVGVSYPAHRRGAPPHRRRPGQSGERKRPEGVVPMTQSTRGDNPMNRKQPTETADAVRPTECACVVLLTDVSVVAGRGGMVDDIMARFVNELDVKLTEDWQGRQAVSPADARRLLAAVEAFQAEHDTAWRDYQRYREAEQEKALEARRAVLAKERAAAEAEAQQMSEAQRRAFEEKRARDLAEEVRKRRERQGDPMPFERWKKAGKAS